MSRHNHPAGDLFASTALADIPKILTLLDRNPHSPTYGCFDRLHWHYKVTDFPSGMSQEFVCPLALACSRPVRGNRFHDRPILRDWVRAGIAFAARRAHRDGSCDDYFPFERADGAAAFSRTIEWVDHQWRVRDTLSGPWKEVEAVALGRDQTSNYNVMSRTFQAGQLASWTDLTSALKDTAEGDPLTEERRF